MKAIFKREMRAYFTTPVGYIFTGIFLIMSGLLFIRYNLYGGHTSLDGMLYGLLIIIMLLISVLTMRLFSEERSLKTDCLLLTSPVKIYGIVLGKFFAAVSVFIITLLLTFLYIIVIAIHATPAYAQIFCNYIGFALLGITYISIGIFISSLTESQIISAIITFAVLFGLHLLGAVQNSISNPFLSEIVSWFVLTARFEEFNLGVLNIVPIVYYLSITALFLFLTGLVIEYRRLK